MSGGYSQTTNLTSKVIHIRSEDGLPLSDANGLKTAFMISFHESVKCELGQSILVSLNSFEFPMSFYSTDNTNNRAFLYEGLTGIPGTLIGLPQGLPMGNYTILEFMDIACASWSSPGTVYTYTYSYITNKITIIYTGPIGYTIKLDNSYEPKSAYQQMGFPKAEELTFSPIDGPVQTLTAPNCVNMNGRTQSLYLRSQLTSTSCIESSTRQYSNILQKIPIDACRDGILFYIPGAGAGVQSLLQTKNINELSLRVTDQQNNLIDTNGIDWDCSIQFDFIKAPDLRINRLENDTNKMAGEHRKLMERKKFRKIKVKKGETQEGGGKERLEARLDKLYKRRDEAKNSADRERINGDIKSVHNQISEIF